MSELQKKLQQGGLSKLPHGLPSGPASSAMNPGSSQKFLARGKRDFTPVTWNQYFERMSDIKVADDTFRVYESGSSGPVCFFLHGGGFSALSWAVLSKALTGMVSCRCTAMDFRGHGDTHTSNDENLEADVMANDVGNVVKKIYGDDSPPIILVGHSMGGAIASHVASRNLIPSVIGLVVIDVVEGTALEALSSMQSFLKSRPSVFKSVESAIEYCVKSGQIKNLESARVSVVGQVKRLSTNETATSLLSHQQELSSTVSKAKDTIYEEENRNEKPKNTPAPSSELSDKESTSTKFKSPNSAEGNQFAWRVDLAKTEKYWKGWFQGLSKMFLTSSAAKLLLLAGVDRLDKDLTVGQMQGKFQMEVMPQVGHAVHEDNPDKVAEVIAAFLVRNRFVESSNLGTRPMFPRI